MLLDLPDDVLAAVSARCDRSTAGKLMQTCKSAQNALKRAEIPMTFASTNTPEEENFARSHMYVADIFPKSSIASKNLPGMKFTYHVRIRSGVTVTVVINFKHPVDVHSEEDPVQRMMQFEISVDGNLATYTKYDYVHQIPWKDFIEERYFIYVSGCTLVQILYGFRGQVHADGCVFQKKVNKEELVRRELMLHGTMIYNHPTYTPCHIAYTFGSLTLRDLSDRRITFRFNNTHVEIVEE